MVRLSKYGQVRTFTVASLVLTAFCWPPPHPGARARHGSGGKLDDTLANLSWSGLNSVVHIAQLVPPPALMKRVSGNEDAETFAQTGARCAARLAKAVEAHAGLVKDVLDWGCGCGRVAVHLPAAYRLCGCDPDGEAVAWCQEHIPGDFRVSPLYPPLPYDADAFDAVLAVSVFTHLTRRNQLRWLRELARVLRPGGLLVASVHGRAAAEKLGVTDLAGIQDHWLDPFMADVLSADYYRTVLQSEAYTRDAWSECFEILAYEEAGLELHDLVVGCLLR